MRTYLFYILFLCISLLVMFNCDDTGTEPNNSSLPPFPEGWVDSPFVVPDGSALYFMHSVADLQDALSQNPEAKPTASYLPGHVGQSEETWWNTDIYVSYKNTDGTWSWPENLGTNINTIHMDNAPWVNDEQTKIIFRRDAVNENTSVSGTYMATRPDKNAAWGEAMKLPANIGDNFINHHLTPSENLYFESTDNQSLYWAKPAGENLWTDPELLANLNSDLMDTQLWINKDETCIYFNRRADNGDTQLYESQRANINENWPVPTLVNTRGFDAIWGEPSFTNSGEMYFVMGLETYLFRSMKNENGDFKTPEKLVFE